ncbi:MAG: glycosyltransferase [Candidatus Aminicenantales bacterium]
MRVCFFGAYDPSYPRHAVIREGLRANGVEVEECRVLRKFKFWIRYPLLTVNAIKIWGKREPINSSEKRGANFESSGSRRTPGFLIVPEFCQKDVPLAKVLSICGSKKLIFDPLASRFETKVLDWRRKPPHSLAAWWNFRIDLWSLRLADLVLADTRAHKDYYCQEFGLDPKQVEVLPLGYDEDLFKPFHENSSRSAESSASLPFTILFYGSFLPLHGVETIIEAARILKDRDSSVRFRMIGSGQTFPGAKAAALAYGLSNVEFQGWLPAERLPLEIGPAQICLGIFGRTRKAGRVVPHKIFQAMGMRKTVVTARTAAGEEFFSHRENIYFCDDPLPESLARAVLELKKDEELRERIAQNGFQLVRREYSSRAIGARLLDILKKRFPCVG